jgi:ribose/xylose/arabinose/galactoside ABC-type transport system permease subunit
MKRLRLFLIENAVIILFIILISIAIPASRLPGQFLLQEILTRLGRSSFLVIALLLPIMAGMGLNFGMVLGAMAGQIGLIFVMDWKIVGIPGILLAMLISLPISILLGWLCGSIMNRAKGREMVTGFILGFFMNGVYMMFALYAMGGVISVMNPELLLSRGYGIRNVVDLASVRQALETFIPLRIAGLNIPVLSYLSIAAVSAFIVWFRKTKFGQDMRAVGQDRAVAEAAGIAVDRTRIIAVVISTVLAGFGQIIFLQNLALSTPPALTSRSACSPSPPCSSAARPLPKRRFSTRLSAWYSSIFSSWSLRWPARISSVRPCWGSTSGSLSVTGLSRSRWCCTNGNVWPRIKTRVTDCEAERRILYDLTRLDSENICRAWADRSRGISFLYRQGSHIAPGHQHDNDRR